MDPRKAPQPQLGMEFFKYFSNKKTVLFGLGAIALYALSGPAPAMVAFFSYGAHAYASFLEENAKKKRLAQLEEAIHQLDVNQLKKLGIRSPDALKEKKDQFLNEAIRKKNKKVLYWIIETSRCTDTLSIFYNEFQLDFLNHLSSCDNNIKYICLTHLVLEALFHRPDHIHEMIAMNEMLAMDLLKITCNQYEIKGDKQKLLSLMACYERFFIESDWIPRIFFNVTHDDDLQSILKQAPLFLARKMADHYLLARTLSKSKRQHRVDIFSKGDFDFSSSPSAKKDIPDDLKNANYRALLSGYYIMIKNDHQFMALRNQKMLALTFGLRGKSQVGQEEIQHTYLADPELYWDRLILFYKENKETEKKHMPSEMAQAFEETILRLPADHAEIDYKETLKNFNNGDPVVLPIYLSSGYGDAHIATVGFLKINDTHFLRAEADKGQGRREFCIYLVKGRLENILQDYTFSREQAYNSYRWQVARSEEEKKILSKPLSPQKDNFCSRISAEYAFQIAFFLNRAKLNYERFGEASLSDQDIGYSFSRTWFKYFKLRHQKNILAHYSSQDSIYQNSELFFLAKKRFEKHEKKMEFPKKSIQKK